MARVALDPLEKHNKVFEDENVIRNPPKYYNVALFMPVKQESASCWEGDPAGTLFDLSYQAIGSSTSRIAIAVYQRLPCILGNILSF